MDTDEGMGFRPMQQALDIAARLLLACLLVIALGELGRRAPEAGPMPMLGLPDGSGTATPFLAAHLR